VPIGALWFKIGAPIARLHSLCVMQSMGDAIHPSRMMIMRIVLYKNRFNVYVTNSGEIMINIVLNRTDVSGQDRRIHASSAETPTMVPQPIPLSQPFY
jgi:hypothetical protein